MVRDCSGGCQPTSEASAPSISPWKRSHMSGLTTRLSISGCLTTHPNSSETGCSAGAPDLHTLHPRHQRHSRLDDILQRPAHKAQVSRRDARPQLPREPSRSPHSPSITGPGSRGWTCWPSCSSTPDWPPSSRHARACRGSSLQWPSSSWPHTPNRPRWLRPRSASCWSVESPRRALLLAGFLGVLGGTLLLCLNWATHGSLPDQYHRLQPQPVRLVKAPPATGGGS